MDTEKEHGRQLEYAPILADMHLEILFFFFLGILIFLPFHKTQISLLFKQV